VKTWGGLVESKGAEGLAWEPVPSVQYLQFRKRRPVSVSGELLPWFKKTELIQPLRSKFPNV